MTQGYKLFGAFTAIGHITRRPRLYGQLTVTITPRAPPVIPFVNLTLQPRLYCHGIRHNGVKQRRRLPQAAQYGDYEPGVPLIIHVADKK
jgi:hypothetical protein